MVSVGTYMKQKLLKELLASSGGTLEFYGNPVVHTWQFGITVMLPASPKLW